MVSGLATIAPGDGSGTGTHAPTFLAGRLMVAFQDRDSTKKPSFQPFGRTKRAISGSRNRSCRSGIWWSTESLIGASE
jgi:hypothetical protein